jgi:hypothetical protein
MLAIDILFVMAFILTVLTSFLVVIILPSLCILYCLGFFEADRKNFCRRSLIPLLMYILVFGTTCTLLWLFYFALK